MLMFMYYPYTSLVTTGQVSVQFTLKVVIIVQTWYMHTLLMCSVEFCYAYLIYRSLSLGITVWRVTAVRLFQYGKKANW